MPGFERGTLLADSAGMLFIAFVPAALAFVLFAATLGLGDRASQRMTILPPAPRDY